MLFRSYDISAALAPYALTSSLPTKLSDLTNDLISSWALASSKPSYSYSEITGTPSKLSDFTDDVVSGNYLSLAGGTMSGHIRVGTTDSYDIGSTTAELLNVYSKYLRIPNGGALYGRRADKNNWYIMMTPNSSNGISFGNVNWETFAIQANTWIAMQVRYNNAWSTPLKVQDNYIQSWNLRPQTNNTYDIGTSSLKYASAYIQNVIAGVSVTSPSATITTNNVTNEIVSGSLAIPTRAPSNLDNSKVYLYFSESGSYAE